MNRKWIAAGAFVLGLVSASVPALAQGIEIGPNGVRLIEPRDQDPRRGEDMRRGVDMQRDRDLSRGITQREAVRIARSEGVRDVDSVTERRRTFRVDGADRGGQDITVDIDRMSGDVVSVR